MLERRRRKRLLMRDIVSKKEKYRFEDIEAIPYLARWLIGLNERDLPEVPLGLLQGPIHKNYPLKPTSWGSEFKILASLGPGEVAKPAQLARSGPGSPPATKIWGAGLLCQEVSPNPKPHGWRDRG